MSDNFAKRVLPVASRVRVDDNGENGDEITDAAPDNNQETPEKDGKLQLTVIKYDSGTAKLLPGGRLAPTPSQLATSPLGVIRAYLLKNGYLEKADRNKPFCTKGGIEVTDDITFDHYIQENANTPAADGENAGNGDGRPTKHNIYVLTKEREKKSLDPNVDAFVKKPLDLSNAAKVEFATALAGAPLTSSFTNSSWAAEAGGSIIYPADMTEKEWGIVMRNNNLLSGQFLQKGPVEQIIKVPGQKDITRPGIDVVNVERAYYSAFALKPRRLPDYDITFTITEKAERQLSDLNIEPTDHLFRIPRFHIKDASQVRVFETKGSLETTMAASSFSAESIDVAVGGSGFGISGAAKGGASWSNDEKSASSKFNDTNYMHVVYEFPRVKLILNEETLELSNECKADIQSLRHRRTLEELHRFEKRYGVFFTRNVQLGGKLVSIDESDSVAGASLSEKTKTLKAAAKNSGSQTTSTEKKMTHSMSWSADGGETTFCNNPPKWCPTVTSFYNWRVMKQDDVINIYELIGKLPGYEDIPTLVQNILHINADPKTLVGFSLHLQPDNAKHGKRTLSFGQPEGRHIAHSHMDPALIDPHSLLLHGKELISDVTLKPKEAGYRPYGTAFGIPMTAGQTNISLVKSTKAGEEGIIYPRLKYGVKYPVQYLVNEGEDDEKTTSLFTLQVGGDKSSNLFLYGEEEKAANVMVEFLGKKNTPVKDYSMVALEFSYVLQGATIPHVSNFRFKDIDDIKKPDIEEMMQKIVLPKEPREPRQPEFTKYERGTFDFSPDWPGPQYHNMASWQKTPEVERRLKAFYKKLDDFEDEKRRYKAEKEEHDKIVHDILGKVSGKTQREYELLKTEWDQHQEVMNQFVPFEQMIFQIDYCDEENKKNIITQREAAVAAFKAEQKEKAEKLAKEAKEAQEGKFAAVAQAIAAAFEEAHKEKLKKRTALMSSHIERWTDYKWVLVEKPRLERIKRSMEASDAIKAAKLGADIQKKDDAITMLAEYDLELDFQGACAAFWNNPFFPAAMAKISIPT
ncbi:uncharacterized protein N7483_008003 [Penicillium malachiteum]|uniref:uncharacterized protein n=1 Tax=Penicillium malachiteum TaxID=1324776 RepID=UPI0025490BB8|nr:uncharacterized protein N7483_008003 [Penicillium malachiteum]KAJ5726646.1 hypothetical protein N7483_008003 [Penicillium malachiteum]